MRRVTESTGTNEKRTRRCVFACFLAEWTGHSDYNLKPLYINKIKGFQQLYVVKTCGEIVRIWRFLRCLLENLHPNI